MYVCHPLVHSQNISAEILDLWKGPLALNTILDKIIIFVRTYIGIFFITLKNPRIRILTMFGVKSK